MRIALVTPARAGTRHGNRHTALRWARLLRALGHRVLLSTQWDGAPADLLLALHARRSHDSIVAFHAAHPDAPIVLALTGTDVYRDIRSDAGAQRSLELAGRYIVLQPRAIDELPPRLRDRARVVVQSALPCPPVAALASVFEVCVIGHLREEKDPFRAALAAARLPADSRVRIAHAGAAMSAALRREAQRLQRAIPRYRWLGDLPHGRSMRLLARARAMVISSRLEGGANVVSEAFAVGTAVIASRIPGNEGLLGSEHPALYPVGDDQALAGLLLRAERDPRWLAGLERASARRAALVTPERERAALKRALAGL